MPSLLREAPVARKATKAPVADTAQRKPTVVQIRGSEEYKTWLEGVARKEGFTVSTLVDQALRKFAEVKGHGAPPER